jgi:hypothetical protein
MVSFRVDEDDLIRLDVLARQTSCSRAEVLRCCLWGVRLKSTLDAQALTEVSRVHGNLNRIGGLLKLAIRQGMSDRSRFYGLSIELRDAIAQVRRADESGSGDHTTLRGAASNYERPFETLGRVDDIRDGPSTATRVDQTSRLGPSSGNPGGFRLPRSVRPPHH